MPHLDGILRRLGRAALCAAALVISATSLAAPDADGWMSALDRGSRQKSGPHATVEIISAKSALTPQAENRLAVRFTHEEGWHTYWRMPGDAGLPPEFTFTLPPGLKATAPEFPLPERTVTSGLVSFGYGDVVDFPFRVEVPRGASGNATIRLHVEYLVCREMCVPETADVSLRLPIAVSGRDLPEGADIERAIRDLPERVNNIGSITATIEETRLRIDVSDSAVVSRSLDFLPFEKILKLADAPVSAPAEGGGQSLWLTADEKFAAAPAESIEGVIIADGGPMRGGWAIETKIPLARGTVTPPPEDARENPAPAPAPAAPVPQQGAVSISTAAAILFAFLGGLILNLMPCVFPVLSLKLLDLIKGANSQVKLVNHGVAFTGGVVLTMLVLSGLLIALRGAGHALGWGFQLQSPWVVATLILLFAAITFNLLGFYEFTFGSRVADAEAVRKGPKSGPAASFLTGVLAVIVASPCTAPFMGAALGYALTQPALEALAVFVALGLGMSLPWLLLCLFPGWARKLPKPGPWMETFRRVMAIPMALAGLWLAWVLSRQVDYRGVLVVLCGIGALGVFCWLFGRRQYGRASSVPVMCVMLALTAVSVVWAGSGAFEQAPESRADAGWAPWSEAAVASALEEGHPVFVDFTAAWCLTCQANKLSALDRDEVVERMNALGFVRLEGDWTNRNAEISRVLAQYGRSGVPLYLIYRTDGTVSVLPELLTPGIVLDALEGKR
ncbi:protein-disulfide reductase DsbD [Sutterella sp.]|uniref:protein-disulfide reductase DsbD family protein n=1 Tax=Sutterella sp. TaxID=1981025 RepID=UPI0026DF85CA|nr:thioredoxin family protein [Sutterella sp.]MDO5530848.1 protein-disulfide reductase DsbD family protein [Sutterella sp.]